ncbi:MAG: hypothetical protein HC825_10175, partial [Oscillatoriales cyanobacterium RM1_1_9]|nr:hypothetical protein [Oscillatoriales cyanobacterium RM1_1_9]
MYYLLRRSEVGVAISLVLTGLFYAPMLLIAAGILGLGLLDCQIQKLAQRIVLWGRSLVNLSG